MFISLRLRFNITLSESIKYSIMFRLICFWDGIQLKACIELRNPYILSQWLSRQCRPFQIHLLPQVLIVKIRHFEYFHPPFAIMDSTLTRRSELVFIHRLVSPGIGRLPTNQLINLSSIQPFQQIRSYPLILAPRQN